MPNTQTLLREARESRGVTIKEAAKALKVRERHIQMLEDGKIDELSKEIYLKGFIKTYTSWLNIDGIDINTQFNKEQKKAVPQNRDSVPFLAIGFSLIGGIVRRPGLNIFILSVILTSSFYIFWYNNHKEVSGVDILSSIETVAGQSPKYTNVLEEYKGKDIVLFPHSNVELKITNTESGEEKINNLIDGDLFFLKVEDFLTISTSVPEAIEVFIDNNGEQIPVGTLNTILVQGVVDQETKEHVE